MTKLNARPKPIHALCARTGRSAAAVLIAAPLVTLLPGCPPNPALHPSLSVTRSANVLIISGAGFANVPACAHLSLQSGTAGSRTVGTPSCSNGGFSNFAYPYSYGGCVNPGSTTNATIFGVDTQGSNASAAQTLQIPWDAYCSLQAANCIGTGAACQACGGEGEPACSGTPCVQPPAQGQPVCSNNACTTETCSFEQQEAGVCSNGGYPDLHPTLSNPNDVNSQLICTAKCGHTQGYSPCYPYMDGCQAGAGVTYPSTLLGQQGACSGASTLTGLGMWSCYDNSDIDSTGQCTCEPSHGICPVNQSPGNGECMPQNPC
jgi:hypothetical protein